MKSEKKDIHSDLLSDKSQFFVPGLTVAVLIGFFLWSYWPNIKELWKIWMFSDEFSSGLLVPLLAVYILWSRRETLKNVKIQPAVLFGVLAFIFAQFVRVFGTFYMYGSLERFSIVLYGILFGPAYVWMANFLEGLYGSFVFVSYASMAKPGSGEYNSAITELVDKVCSFSLEMFGYDVVREGNIIRLGETTVAVAEACNGLRMITAFFVIIGLVVLLANRPLWEKAVVFASCLPIALLCNTIRLSLTSIAFTYLEGPGWETLFHDFGGYAMMPLALAMAVGQLWLLKALTTPPEEIEEEVVKKAIK